MYNPETREQIIELKDGRTIFKTHNGFKCWVEYKDEVVAVTPQYYTTTSQSRMN